MRELFCTDNSCDPDYQTSDGETCGACSEDGSLCVTSSVSSGTAQYNVSMSYCVLNGSLERTCQEDIQQWTGSIPFLIKRTHISFDVHVHCMCMYYTLGLYLGSCGFGY